MNDNSILAEIRRVRGEYAEKFNHDISAMVEDAKRRQQASDHRVVQLPPRPAQIRTTVEFSN